MKALVVGASAGVGRALSEALAEAGWALLLAASDERDLLAQAAHLRLVWGARVETVAAEAGKPAEFLDRIRLAADDFGSLDGLFFPIGLSRPDDRGALSFEHTQSLMNANLLVVMGVVGCFLPALLASGRGTIVGFGSMAAVRGRRSNIAYAAAKRGLESYFESLRHLAAQTEVRVQFYRLGYVATQQSFGKKLLFPRAETRGVANAVLHNLNNHRELIYVPAYWSIIAQIIHILPWPVFKRLDF